MRRIQLFPLFEDYDRVNNGSVTISQVPSVLYLVLWLMYSVLIIFPQ